MEYLVIVKNYCFDTLKAFKSLVKQTSISTCYYRAKKTGSRPVESFIRAAEKTVQNKVGARTNVKNENQFLGVGKNLPLSTIFFFFL